MREGRIMGADKQSDANKGIEKALGVQKEKEKCKS